MEQRSGMDLPQKVEPSPARPQGKAFWVGITLIALSFSTIALYLVILFLPVSLAAKGGIAIAVSIISWSLFFVGMLLAGKEGYHYFKELVRSRFRKS